MLLLTQKDKVRHEGVTEVEEGETVGDHLTLLDLLVVLRVEEVAEPFLMELKKQGGLERQD